MYNDSLGKSLGKLGIILVAAVAAGIVIVILAPVLGLKELVKRPVSIVRRVSTRIIRRRSSN
jgi:hypothetical protein